uniref:Phytanoyl-CoA dioxygenase n=1 Tax=Phaeomonas parva TaxID=124430 RepID=A0A7S1U8X6_9STRA|mmetsp:Transcript_33815/g.106820  ORF Transcript_33815/g.106820 Transcript_33815/m.106820 type:complete len:355 (+) Transcript_33815:90-1154(+)
MRSRTAALLCGAVLGTRRAAVPLTRQRHMAAMTDAAAAGVPTARERFLFDLNGYLQVRGAVNEEEIAALNAAVDNHYDEAVPRAEQALRNAGTAEQSAFGESGARSDLGGVLNWEGPDGDAFRGLLAHPRLAPYLAAFCGEGYRLDHQPLVMIQNTGSEGFNLHGGPLSGADEGTFNPELQYRCVNGQPWTSLLAMAVHLVDAPEGAGGFCVVRGSHKLNFAMPGDFASGKDPNFAAEFAEQPVTKAGDVVFFSEATIHGALPWMAQHERRVALLRFAPPNFCYGRAYLDEWGGEDVLGMCTPAQRAVLAPPFAPRLERVMSTAQGEAGPDPEPMLRNPAKKAHDMKIFRTQYF